MDFSTLKDEGSANLLVAMQSPLLLSGDAGPEWGRCWDAQRQSRELILLLMDAIY